MTELKQMTLTVDDLLAGYDGTRILEGVSFSLKTGERLGVLGRNGMGKTTTLASIMGLTEFQGGNIAVDGQSISAMSTFQRARLGLGYVPQTRDVFPSLTVEENLLSALGKQPESRIEHAYQLFPRLKERKQNYGNQLSGGEQQMLSVARALMGNPSILILDEPLEGLSPLLAEQLMTDIEHLVETSGMGCILVEQHVDVVLRFATRVIILERGKVAFYGTPAELEQQPKLLEETIGLQKISA
ncbi:ABC transporter ATP-binding protein [Saccharospirillum alexandrii]|uniref:ABC transporter ATP-binding protein n=1 Tax=Saccharospirillum alexandrii TaxID=2448477 RepID=UPI000FD93A07|nr:ABC transporter ATP-binding protein [Saccharospirillum alexandrii]